MAKRSIVYYVATTLDGFIAREDGSFAEFPWDDAFGADLLEAYPETFPTPFHGRQLSAADNNRFDAVLMGRKTYEVGLRGGLTSPYPSLQQFVFSTTLTESPDPAVTLVRQDAPAFVADLKQSPGRDVWLCGGGSLASTLYEAGLVDEVIVKLNPIVFGSGIPLLGGRVSAPGLTLREHRIYESGHAVLSYSVNS